MADGDDVKAVKIEDPATESPSDKRLKELRQTFHPMFEPSLTISDQRGAHEVTFQFRHEDHTLCNPLREVLNQHPGVLHVGYTIPHPSEHVVDFILHVKEGYTCAEVMRDGFNVLMNIFDTMGRRFAEAVYKYKTENGIPLDSEDIVPEQNL
ncbi:uncharacterized protein LOC129595409 [Paramacrobiotus metropolitanus]|uniref:uncharacterized protein LOC129595409 n=1 Tax=Paramacrobiotus metropolitanus TaxID=2943436 RepID=UPI00244603F2|nr:uncharacterized protein LOC129595409 [Paramacrobiotus metropolitanus]